MIFKCILLFCVLTLVVLIVAGATEMFGGIGGSGPQVPAPPSL